MEKEGDRVVWLLTVCFSSAPEEGRNAREDGVGEGHGLGAGLLGKSHHLLEVAADGAVGGALEPLRPERAFQAAGLPERPVQHPDCPGRHQQRGQAAAHGQQQFHVYNSKRKTWKKKIEG